MTATDQTTIPGEALAEASILLAETFGLGDDAEESTQWPVDEGDAVIGAVIQGELVGTAQLAVNAEVIARIVSDPSRLHTAFQSAIDILAASLGTELTVVELVDATEAPVQRVEIRDGNQLCALFGITLHPAAAEGGDAAVAGDDVVDGGAGEAAFAAEFEPSMLTDGGRNGVMLPAGPLNVLHDVEMDVTVELGRTTMPIRELLALQPGMVVEIDRAAGAPIDVLVNGHHIASGEVVVIDEEFGIRITEIVSDGNPTG